MFDHLTLMNLQLYVIQYKTIQEYSTAGFVAVLFYHNIKKNKIPSNKCNHNHQSFQ